MKQMADGVFEVPSDSDYSRTYVVNLTGQYPQCTCTHYAIQRNKLKAKGLEPNNQCKHIKAVLRSDPSALQALQQADAKARADADAAAKAEQEAKREKMRAELVKMRADLEGTEPTAVAAKRPTKATTPKPGTTEYRESNKRREAETDDLMTALEAQIIAARNAK